MKHSLLITGIIGCAFLSVSCATWNPFSKSSWEDAGNTLKGGFETVGKGFQSAFSSETWSPVANFFKDTVYDKGLKVAGQGVNEYVYDKGIKVAGQWAKNLVTGGWEKIKEVPGQINKIADTISALPDTLRGSIKPIDAIPDQFTAGLATLDDSITDIIKTQLNTLKQKNDVKEQLDHLPVHITELQDLEKVLMQAFDELEIALKTLATPASMEQCTTLATTNEKKAFAPAAQGGAASACSCQHGTGVMCEMREALYTARQNAIGDIANIHSSIDSVNSVVNKQVCIGAVCYPTLPQRLHYIATTIDQVLP